MIIEHVGCGAGVALLGPTARFVCAATFAVSVAPVSLDPIRAVEGSGSSRRLMRSVEKMVLVISCRDVAWMSTRAAALLVAR